MANDNPFSRRKLLGGIALGIAAAQATEAGPACSAKTFNGTLGHIAADSKPIPLKLEQPPKGSPNVIYIVLDDTGFADLHCFGSEISTPNIFDNTMIYLLSDNGGAPEGGVKGGFFHNYGDPTTVHDWYSHLDELGTDRTLPLYQRPWAMASDSTQFADIIDITPTVLDIIGLEAPLSFNGVCQGG